MFKIFKPQQDPAIEFLCHEEDWDVIPKPVPARSMIPNWFKALPPKIGNQGLNSSTLKRCHPFLDAISIGWIIPLAADVEFVVNSDCSGISYQWNFYKTMVENHGMDQITTSEVPNPQVPKPPMKFINHWAIRVPSDYSVLFLPPINRPDPRFECFAGLVDCDGYFEFVNFPFLFHEPNWSGILPAGTPLVQAIPIKRSTILKNGTIRPFAAQDHADINMTRRRRASHESLYKDNIWTKK